MPIIKTKFGNTDEFYIPKNQEEIQSKKEKKKKSKKSKKTENYKTISE